ncbi:hypothetical protein DPMN_113270 [Dreissena polymorpha]|uniref:Uncharacterized protein n=1 Tax=Dreissena polymorpha TaxID=45954 RepID=A0A9D4QQU2_DREPO|nr:hypothetical protein DPMN_113270 [Dreissena polymorpha]
MRASETTRFRVKVRNCSSSKRAEDRGKGASEERPTAASTSHSSRAEQPAAHKSAAPKIIAEGEAKEVARPKWLKFKKCPISWCPLNFYYKKGHVFGYHYPTTLAREDMGLSESELWICNIWQVFWWVERHPSRIWSVISTTDA